MNEQSCGAQRKVFEVAARNTRSRWRTLPVFRAAVMGVGCLFTAADLSGDDRLELNVGLTAPVRLLGGVAQELKLDSLRLHTECACYLCSDDLKADDKGNKNYQTASLRGRVVWLGDGLEKLGINSVPESRQKALAIETDDGELVPVVEDVRGRAFRNDPELMKLHLELLVRRYSKTPTVQVIGLYSLEKGGKFELDYWCEICAIAMYELKECECCQGPTALRKRKVP